MSFSLAYKMRIEIKLSIVVAKAPFIKTTFYRDTGPKFMEEIVATTFGVFYFYGVETLICRNVDQKHLESFKM
jgi:hypothetical protein